MNVQLKTPKDMAIASIEWFVVLALIALSLRFIFRVFGAEATGDGFTAWLYETSAVLVQPFRSVFPDTVVKNKHAFEFATLFAGVAYMGLGNIAMGLVERWSPKRK